MGAEGTAGRLQGKVTYLNRINDLLNVDPAHTTSQPPISLTSLPSRYDEWGLTNSLGLRGAGGSIWASCSTVTVVVRMDHPSTRWLSLALTQKCQ